MAALDIEDRKRPLDADGPSASKRPHLERSTSSYASNGSLDATKGIGATHDEEDDGVPAYKGLEVRLMGQRSACILTQFLHFHRRSARKPFTDKCARCRGITLVRRPKCKSCKV